MISALHVEGLGVARGERLLFDALSFEVHAGEALVLTGPNGAGKTSLLRTLAGLLRPACGAVRWVGEGGELDASEARSGGLHWLGWQDGLKGQRTVQQELRFWARWASDDNALEEALVALGLERLRSLEVRRLSAGQRRRLALARLLAPSRAVWLLDEPLAPLDAEWRGRFGSVVADHLAHGGMVIAAVHDPLPVPARELALGAA
jgi:heme exporter protein A